MAVSTTFLLHTGKEIKDSELLETKKHLAVAKNVVGQETNRFYLRLLNGHPVDTRKETTTSLKSTIRYREVTEQVYNKYKAIVRGESRVSLRSIDQLL